MQCDVAIKNEIEKNKPSSSARGPAVAQHAKVLTMQKHQQNRPSREIICAFACLKEHKLENKNNKKIEEKVDSHLVSKQVSSVAGAEIMLHATFRGK